MRKEVHLDTNGKTNWSVSCASKTDIKGLRDAGGRGRTVMQPGRTYPWWFLDAVGFSELGTVQNVLNVGSRAKSSPRARQTVVQ